VFATAWHRVKSRTALGDEGGAALDLDDAADRDVSHRRFAFQSRRGDRHACRLEARQGRARASIGSTISTQDGSCPAGVTMPRSSE